MITLGLLRGKRRPMSLALPLTKTARKHRRYRRPLRVVEPLDRAAATDRNRRVPPVAISPVECRFTEPDSGRSTGADGTGAHAPLQTVRAPEPARSRAETPTGLRD